MRRRTAERWVAGSFLLATAAGVGFVVAYLSDAGTQALGTLLGGACAALALGLVLWSAQLLPSGTYVEQREPMKPARDAQDAFVATLDRGADRTPGLVRRSLLLAGLALTAAVVVPLRSLLLPTSRPPAEALDETPWREGVRLVTRENEPVRAEELVPGTVVTVFPEGDLEADDATTIVIRLDPRDVPLLAPRIAAGVVRGIIAYSKICSHAGCPVGLYEQTTRQLLCPCHQSVFDVLDAARPIAGPAARALPQLPLGVDEDGFLIATGNFDGQSGPTWWRPV